MGQLPKKGSKIYLGGPMTGLPKHNTPTFMAAARALRKLGYRVVNPAELDIGQHKLTWEACLKRDLRHLLTCTGIVLLPGWEQSRGAKLERFVGAALSIPQWRIALVGKQVEFQGGI